MPQKEKMQDTVLRQVALNQSVSFVWCDETRESRLPHYKIDIL